MTTRTLQIDVTDDEADALHLDTCTATIEVWDDGYKWGARVNGVEIPASLVRVWSKIGEMMS